MDLRRAEPYINAHGKQPDYQRMVIPPIPQPTPIRQIRLEQARRAKNKQLKNYLMTVAALFLVVILLLIVAYITTLKGEPIELDDFDDEALFGEQDQETNTEPDYVIEMVHFPDI